MRTHTGIGNMLTVRGSYQTTMRKGTGRIPQSNIPRLLSCLLVLWLMFLAAPERAWAHAVLVDANPGPGSVLDESPAQVELTFNERLESPFSLEVRDGRGSVIGGERAAMSEDRRRISVSLPRLDRGVYTVSYRVLSADGHPVSGSYVFSVGEPLPANASVSGASGLPGHAHQHGNPYGSGTDARQVFILSARVWYYLSLLAAAGLVYWNRMLPATLSPGERLANGLLLFRRSLMLSWIAPVGSHIPDLGRHLPRGGRPKNSTGLRRTGSSPSPSRSPGDRVAGSIRFQ